MRQVHGSQPGEQVERLGFIRVADVRRELLSRMLIDDYGDHEATLEGFPELTGREFVQMFCEHMECSGSTEVTRIEFEYVATP